MDSRFESLMDAASCNELDRFRGLLDDDPDLLQASSSQSHPNLLQFLVVDGGLGALPDVMPFIDLMLERGASLDGQLVAAASVNALPIVDRLLSAGAGIESGHPWTALEECLYWGHQDLATYLISDCGASIMSLRCASAVGNLDWMARCFDECGELTELAGHVHYPFGTDVSDDPADIMAQAMLLALKNRQFDAASLLLERGADINRTPPGNHEQCTMLHQATTMNDDHMVDWLMDRGARADIRDLRFDEDAIGWARHFGQDEMASHIAARGAASGGGRRSD